MADAKYREARYARRVEIDGRLVAVDAPQHGKPGTYCNWGCRCEPCTDAHRVYTAQKREQRKRHRRRLNGHWISTLPVRHGRTSTRINYGCECDPCREASNADRRELNCRRKTSA